MKHTISVLVENKFGVLTRVTGMFSGRGFNIETLNVGPTHRSEYSRITAVIIGDEQALDQALKQLEKLVNVIEVTYFGEGDYVSRELLLLKVEVSEGKRPELIQICDIFGADIVDVTLESFIIEMTGNQNKVKSFLDLVRPFGILKMARTGSVALMRGNQEF
ncbi:MAG: acetolactate synthase small subunit [Puniceicoccaceae bacterium]